MNNRKSATLPSLLAIFDIVKKAELEEHCRTALVTRTDLANLIMACQLGAIPIRHVPIFKHHHPSHLQPTDEDFEAFAKNGVGPLSREAQKFTNKIGQMFEQRRLFCGHLFLPVLNESEWHLFYFDQRDTDRRRNHWEHGSHLHLMNKVTHPRVSVLDLVSKIDNEERPKLGGGLHIRFARQDEDPDSIS